MYENIENSLLHLRQNWSHLRTFTQQVRGVAKDRKGKRYWRYVCEYSPGHFEFIWYAWPSLTHASDQPVGFIRIGVEQGETIWRIYDVQVGRPAYERRGVGTSLVQAAIAHVRAYGGHSFGGKLYTVTHTRIPFCLTGTRNLALLYRNSTEAMPLHASGWILCRLLVEISYDGSAYL